MGPTDSLMRKVECEMVYLFCKYFLPPTHTGDDKKGNECEYIENVIAHD